MGDIHYMTVERGVEDISRKFIQWEEKLDITIGKKDEKHHYYTKEDICLIECVEKLSHAGVSDQELKSMVPDLLKAKEHKIEVRGQAVARENELQEVENLVPMNTENINKDMVTYTREMSAVDMAVTMERVLQNNNIVLEQGICDVVTESIKKEMTYLLLAKDQVEEERYKRLDTLIRQQQLSRKESGKKNMGWFSKERFGFTG